MSDSSTRAASTADNAADEIAFKGVVLAALALQQQPVSISRLRSSLPSPFRGKPASFKTRLENLAGISFFPTGKPTQPLVWDRSPAVFVETVILAALSKKPLTISEIETKTRAKLKHLSPADRRRVFDSLLSTQRIFRWPKKPGTKSEKFGISPPDPRDYLASALKALSKAVAKVADVFAEVGIPPSKTHAAAMSAIQSMLSEGERKPLVNSASPAADETLLGLLADHMAVIDPRSRRGAPVLIGDLRPAVAFLFPTPQQFDAALIRLERAGRVSLLRYDPALAAEPLGPSRLVTDGQKTYSGVSLR
jgi:hypothetical protein